MVYGSRPAMAHKASIRPGSIFTMKIHLIALIAFLALLSPLPARANDHHHHDGGRCHYGGGYSCYHPRGFLGFLLDAPPLVIVEPEYQPFSYGYPTPYYSTTYYVPTPYYSDYPVVPFHRSHHIYSGRIAHHH